VSDRWGAPPSTDDRIWMMERGFIERDERLLDKYYSAKAYMPSECLYSP